MARAVVVTANFNVSSNMMTSGRKNIREEGEGEIPWPINALLFIRLFFGGGGRMKRGRGSFTFGTDFVMITPSIAFG